MKRIFLISLVGICSITSLIFGIGIRATPATIVLENVPLGKTFDLEKEKGIVISIYNDSDIGYRYHIAAEKPSASDTRATGYFDFPEPAWCWFDRETITIEPRTEEKIRLYMRIPDSTQYYNRHWLVAITITPFEMLTSNYETGASIAVGAYLLYRVETMPRGDGGIKKNEDELFTVPSVVEFVDVESGKEYEKTVKIISPCNDKKVMVTRLDPLSEVAKLTILTAPGFIRLNKAEWLSYDSIAVIKDRIGYLKLKLVTPQNYNDQNYNFEELLLLKCEDKKAFIRIRIFFKKEEKKK